jgi:hypothetical protein
MVVSCVYNLFFIPLARVSLLGQSGIAERQLVPNKPLIRLVGAGSFAWTKRHTFTKPASVGASLQLVPNKPLIRLVGAGFFAWAKRHTFTKPASALPRLQIMSGRKINFRLSWSFFC